MGYADEGGNTGRCMEGGSMTDDINPDFTITGTGRWRHNTDPLSRFAQYMKDGDYGIAESIARDLMNAWSRNMKAAQKAQK